MPSQTRERYLEQKKTSDFQVWRFDNGLKKLAKGKALRIETTAKAKVLWTDDHWKMEHTVGAKDTGIGIFVTDLKPKRKKAKAIEFTFHWEDADKWENQNYSVEME